MHRVLPVTAILLFSAIDVPSDPTGVVSGTVTDVRSRRPLGHASVVVLGTDLRTMATATGTFEIHGVPTGQQRIQADCVGYCPGSVAADVIAGGHAEVIVTIQVGPDGPSKPIVFPRPPESSDPYQTEAGSIKLLAGVDRSPVTTGQPIRLELALLNNGKQGLRFPKDLRPYLKASYLYPNGDRDSVPCWIWKRFDGAKDETVLIRPGGRHTQVVVIPGCGIPGEYEIKIILHSAGRKWMDMPDRSYASKAVSLSILR